MAHPIVVAVGPLASASANNICASQLCPGAFALALNGTLASGNSATSIAAAQAVAGAGDLTLNGTSVVGGVAHLGGSKRILITSAGNDTGITFTVKGTLSGDGVVGIAYQSETITGSNASVVSTTKLFTTVTAVTASAAAAGNVSVGVNGVATLDKARRVRITSAGDDSGKTFTVYGTDWNSNPISEVVTGANASTADSTLDFMTVTRISPSAAPAAAVIVGTNGVASSRPIILDHFGDIATALQVVVSGTVNYTVQQTLDDPIRVGPSGITWVSHPDTALVGATATKQGQCAYTPHAVRLLLNSGSGTATFTVIQSGNYD